MAAPSKRLRQKAAPAAGDGSKEVNPSMLKSPNPRALKAAKNGMKDKGDRSSTTSTATPSPSILKRSPSLDGISRRLSFGTPQVHDIEAQNPGKSGKMTPERAKEVLEAIKIAEGKLASDSSEARSGMLGLCFRVVRGFRVVPAS